MSIFIVYSKRVPLKLPYDMEGLKSLIADLKSVKDDHWFSVIYLFSAAYLFKQTFAIPGSFVLVRCACRSIYYIYNCQFVMYMHFYITRTYMYKHT